MAVLLVAIAVMLTLMTVAMPVWRQQQKREREEELLFRLKQYAHALALYQRRLPGASPPSIDELVKQRFLRRKYLDPITGKEFAVLRVGQVSPGMSAGLPGQPGIAPPLSKGPGGNPPGGNPPAGTTSPRGAPSTGRGGQLTQPGIVPGTGMGGAVGGIRGVVSTSTDTSLRSWKGRTRYDQWEVAVEDVTPRFFGPQPPQPGQNRGRGGMQGPGQVRPGQPSTTPSSSNPYGRPINPR
jgi:type II secretory pathway pseudopilin PulG